MGGLLGSGNNTGVPSFVPSRRRPTLLQQQQSQNFLSEEKNVYTYSIYTVWSMYEAHYTVWKE